MRCRLLILMLSVSVVQAEALADENPATRAQSAANRLDIAYSFTDDTPNDSAVLQAQYTQIFARQHQVVLQVPFADANTSESPGLRLSDTRLGYSYTPGQELTANPWVPSEIGTGVGLSIPTGDFDEGTSTGSWVMSPRLGFVAVRSTELFIAPSVQYVFSFGEKDEAARISSLVVKAPVTYVGVRSAWFQWTPEYLRSLRADDGAFVNSFRLGKLFTPNLAISLEYSRSAYFVEDAGEFDEKNVDVWSVFFAFPFGY